VEIKSNKPPQMVLPSSIPYDGVSHIAFYADDMHEATRQTEEELHMPLLCLMDIPGGGQHSFHDAGNGALMSFMWFPKEARADKPDRGFSHLAFLVADAYFDKVREDLEQQGLISYTIYHGHEAPMQVDADHPDVWIRSMYLKKTMGMVLEIASVKSALDPRKHIFTDPKNAEGEKIPYKSIFVKDAA
jgi:hypothetical protein